MRANEIVAELVSIAAVLGALGLAACSDPESDDAATAGTNAGTTSAGTGGSPDAGGTSGVGGAGGIGAGGAGGAGAGGAGAGGVGDAGGSDSGSGDAPSFEEASRLIEEYAAAHPGQDGDITSKTPAELAADPAAQQLAALCGENQLPVFPALVWEYGGSDHAWINYEESALVYCVYLPVSPSSNNWEYDAAEDHVVADVYVLYPEDNPCKDELGADQVASCIGDPTNFEILVDTASLNDGMGAGLSLSEASTELRLVLPDGTKVHLWDDA